jgi:hypothetical protein
MDGRHLRIRTWPKRDTSAPSHKLARGRFLAPATVALATLAFAAPAPATTETFNYTGAAQTWTVPAGVTEATFDLYGAQGAQGAGPGGLGGRATATIPLRPGDSIQVNVGGGAQGALGGFNGGGNVLAAFGDGGGGGGASDVRIGGTGLTDRVLVAGGGGGGGGCSTPGQRGGGGGGLVGEAAVYPQNLPPCFDQRLGGGGSQSAGGTASNPATPGTFGVGGNGNRDAFDGGGGGGGGWYGGGGGLNGGGGGGGSGHGPSGTTFGTGVRSGNGLVTVTYTLDTTAPTIPDPPPVITNLKVSPKRFAADPDPTPLFARKGGAKIKLTLSEDAKVRFRVRSDPPRQDGGPDPANPHVFKRQLSEGENSLAFTATLGKRTFSAGKYLLIARARDSTGQASERVTAKFRVKG